MPLHDRRAVLRAALTGGTLAAGAVALTSPASAAERTDAARAAEQRAGRRVAVIGFRIRRGRGRGPADPPRHPGGPHRDGRGLGLFPKDGGRTFTSMTRPTSRSVWFETRTDMPFSTPFGGFDLINRDAAAGAGVLGIERFEQMKVYVGRGVGGGSLVNGGMAVTPGSGVLRAGVAAGRRRADVLPLLPRGPTGPWACRPRRPTWWAPPRTTSSPAWPPPTRPRPGTAPCRCPTSTTGTTCAAKGHRRAERSALAQEVIYGNNHGKKSLTRTLLKKALDTGLVNSTSLTEVTGITRQEDGA